MWWLSVLAGLAAVVSGLLGLSDARDVIERIAPVLVFLVAVTVIAGADAARDQRHRCRTEWVMCGP
jgi:arsenical pump membrane protein